MAIKSQTRISGAAYEGLALAEPDRKWELRDGCPRKKPPMTAAQNELEVELSSMVRSQVDPDAYRVRIDSGRVRRPGATYSIPDAFVVPTAFGAPLIDQQDVLEVYGQPLPLVVEVWSPSTGTDDVEEKPQVYQGRGDREIWLIHLYDRTLAAWRRLPDVTYQESMHRDGVVHPTALPAVAIDLNALFGA